MRTTHLAILLAATACSGPPRRGDPPIAPEAPTSSMPPALENHRVVEEGFTGPTRPELLPYVRKRPLVHVSQSGWPEESPTKPTFDLVVFDDGKVFFEGESCVASVGLRVDTLAETQLAALRRKLDERCPALERSTRHITHTSTMTVACQVQGVNYTGLDMCSGLCGEPGTNTVVLAAEIIESIGIRDWLGDATDPQCGFKPGHTAFEIERTLSPVPWKKYAPVAGTTAVKQGVAADGAAPRR